MGMPLTIEELEKKLVEDAKLPPEPTPKLAPQPSEVDHKQIVASYKKQFEEMNKVLAENKIQARRLEVCIANLSETIKQGVKESVAKEIRCIEQSVNEEINKTLHYKIKIISDYERVYQDTFYKRIFSLMDKRSVANAVVAVLLSLTVACVVAHYSKPEPVLSQEQIAEGKKEFLNLIDTTQKEHAKEVEKASHIHIVLPPKGEKP